MPRTFDVNEIFKYRAGELYWGKRRRGVKNISKPAGSLASNGYRVVFVDGIQWRYHRVIWAFFHGWSRREIDHINRDKTDNRIENLREVSKSENLCNVRRRTRGTKGVWKKSRRWCAAIQKNNIRTHLGYFDTKREALSAYNMAAIKLHGEYACLNLSM